MEIFLVEVPTHDGDDVATEFYIVETMDPKTAIDIACRECGRFAVRSRSTAKTVDELFRGRNIAYITSTEVDFKKKGGH